MKLDRSCPAQRADEAPVDYLRRLSRIGRRYIPKGEQMASVNFAELPDEVVPKFSELMRAAVERNLYRTDNMAPGEMRAVMVVDEQTGQKQRHFIGPDSFVKAMGQPCRRVVSGLFQSDVPRFRAMTSSIPPSETRYAAFGKGPRPGLLNPGFRLECPKGGKGTPSKKACGRSFKGRAMPVGFEAPMRPPALARPLFHQG
jgi:hypothetical protein